MAATAVGVLLDVPAMAYGAAVVASVAVCATRPAQSVLVPRFAVEEDRLTAANVVLGWVESGGILVAGLLVGGLITMDGVTGVFLMGALLVVLASCLVVTLSPGPDPAVAAHDAGRPGDGRLSGVATALADPKVRPLVALLGAQGVVIGALDLLFVVLAVDSLDRGLAWVGYLNSAYGLGAVLAGFVGALLVGRGLGRPVVIATLMLSGALVALTAAPGVVGTVLLLACVADAGA